MKKLFLVIPLVLSSSLFAFDPAYHMYLGSQSFDVWQDFDPDFYAQITGPYANLEAIRFYYIGLTLPDMFEYQDGIANLIDTLYGLRDELLAIFDHVPLIIEDWTHDQVQVTINFNHPPPNNNIVKLWQMAVWARNNQPDEWHRALVYGTLMHAIQDLCAHMVLQPSRLGYGLAIQSDSMHAEYDPIFLGEMYHELFTPTYIPTWDFVENNLYRARWTNNGNWYYAEPGVGYFDFHAVYNIAGQRIGGWQDYDFGDVQTFVDAANGVGYSTQNLTRERLEAYIHGWGIMMFMLYGYRKGGGDCGGVLAHPSWNFSQILEYYSDMGDDYFRVSQVPNLVALLETFGAEGILSWAGAALFDLFIDQELEKWLNKIIESELGSYSWPWYLQTTTGIDVLWNAVPQQYQSDTLTRYFSVLRRQVEFWDAYALVTKPNLRDSYSMENSDAMALTDVIKGFLDNGPTSYSFDGYTLSRKAGLCGGMYSVPDIDYYREPGFSRMHFQDGSTPIFTSTPIAVEGTPKYLNLNYKIITFGNTKFEVWANNIDLGPGQLLKDTILTGPEVISENLEFNAQYAVNQGYNELSFLTRTRKKVYPYDYTTIMNSDYRGAYTRTAIIYNNQYYQSVFNNGDPTRDSDENPITNPTLWWPYVLCVYPTPAPPTGLVIVNQPTVSSVKIQWQDNSLIEKGFQIARRVDDGSWNESYKTVRENTTQYIDTVSLMHKYDYKVCAYDKQKNYSEWSNTVQFRCGALAQSDYPEITAFNNQKKVIRGTDGKIHLLFYAGDSMCYSYSTDNGVNFDDWLDLGFGNRTDTTPSLVFNGNLPFAAYGTNECLGGPDYRLRYYTLWLRDPVPYPDRFYNSSSTTEDSRPTPPSIIYVGDSCYITFKHFSNNIVVVGPTVDNTTTLTYVSLSGLPTIGYDTAGRLVVVTNNDGYLQLYYRAFNSAWSSVGGIPGDVWVHGSPSLWMGSDQLCVVFEGGYTQAGIDEVGLVYIRFVWESGNYVMQPPELITANTDWSENCIDGYGCLASSNVVLWRYQGDIWYSRRSGADWEVPVNISNTGELSNYPQGVAFYQGSRYMLFAAWTEKLGSEYYLTRQLITLPNIPPGGGSQGDDVQLTMPFAFDKMHQNPTREILRLRFTSPDERRVNVMIYDIAGRMVKQAYNGQAIVGENEIAIRVNDLSAGVYFVRAEADDCMLNEKVILLQ